jgi:hypothetical protein
VGSRPNTCTGKAHGYQINDRHLILGHSADLSHTTSNARSAAHLPPALAAAGPRQLHLTHCLQLADARVLVLRCG